MTLYASTDVNGYHRGDHHHTRKRGDVGPFRLDCAECEAGLQRQERRRKRMTTVYEPGWAKDLKSVPLTPDEQRVKDEHEQQAQLAVSGMGQGLVAALLGNPRILEDPRVRSAIQAAAR